MSDSRKVGTIFLFFGIFFLLLGMLLFFDRKFLAMGNILFLLGFSIVSGPLPTLKFFGLYGDQIRERWEKKWRGLITFIGGIVLVLSGYSVLGMFLELFGFLNLFAPLFPIALVFLRRVPVIGAFLNLPGVAVVADRLAGSKSSESMV